MADFYFVPTRANFKVSGSEGWLGFPDLWSGQEPDGTDINPCGEVRWSPEGPVSQIHSPHLHAAAPWIFSDLLKYVQMLKRDWGVQSNGKLPHLFIPSKTATLVPEFAVEDLPLGRIAALVSEFAVKDLPLGRTLMIMHSIPGVYSISEDKSVADMNFMRISFCEFWKKIRIFQRFHCKQIFSLLVLLIIN